MISYWFLIPAIAAVLCGVFLFIFCNRQHRFQDFIAYTLIFDGLFITIQGTVTEKFTTFHSLAYIIYVALMLTVPVFYFFAVKYLLKEKGVEKKDYSLFLIPVICTVLLMTVIARIPQNDRALFQHLLNGKYVLGDTVSTGASVLLAMDNAAFIFFLVELLGVLVFCGFSLNRYRKTLENYYSSREGKSLTAVTIVLSIVAIRFLIYAGMNFFPGLAATTTYHIIQTILFSAFFIIVANLSAKVNYTAEELGKLTAQNEARSEKSFSDATDELIRSRMKSLEESHFFLDADTDLIGISSSINVNCKYLAEFIRHSYGETFMVYVNRLRIEYSEALLKDSALTMEDIAEKSGYTSVSTFYRNFIKIKGISPSHFRK